jgi:hypothetical protein
MHAVARDDGEADVRHRHIPLHGDASTRLVVVCGIVDER